MYSQWRQCRNDLQHLDAICVDLEDPSSINASDLCMALCKFLAEVKKLDGSEFPPKTLYDIIIGVQMYLESVGVHYKFLEDQRFVNLKFTLDNLMKERCTDGFGMHVQQAQVISFEQENYLWETGILGTSNPSQLLDTVLYLIGITCALRAGKEHRQLRSLGFNSQFSIQRDRNNQHFIRYQEDVGLKTNKGGLKHRKVASKVVPIYPGPNINHCPVSIFLFYNTKLPKARKCNALYLRPLKNFKPGGAWFGDCPVGVNSLQKVVGNMCARAGFEGHYTNHSLRATSATRMYNAGVEEQVIQEFTGHHSLAIRSYKKTSDNQ